MKIITKTMAVLAVAIMLSTIFAGVIASDNAKAEEAVLIEEENNKSICILGAVMIVSLIAGTAIGGGSVFGYLAFNNMIGNPSSDPGPQNRTNEINNFSGVMQTGTAWNTNAINQINQIWGFTNEHWIRQCEVAAADMWGKGSNPNSFNDHRTWILDRSGTYYNSAVLIENAFEQLNASYKTINERLNDWKDSKYNGVYKDISIGFTVDNGSVLLMESDEYWNATILSYAKADGNRNTVYISGGEITPFVNGSVATKSSYIQRMYLDNTGEVRLDENRIEIAANGTTDLDGISAFKPGVYVIPDGIEYAGNITQTYSGSSDAIVYPAMIVKSGLKPEIELIHYDETKSQPFIYKGEGHNSIELSAKADGSRRKVSDFTQPLIDMQSLMDTTERTISSALSSSLAVWDIYNKAGESSVYLSTLLFANVDRYDNVELNSTTREILSILAMGQMASYYDRNSGKLMAGTYTMSDSMSVYMLGSIKVGDGKEEYYEDVIFTPYISEYSQTFEKNKENKIDQYTQIAVWQRDYKKDRIDWDERPGEILLENTLLINVGSSSSIYIKDILFFDENSTPIHKSDFTMEVREMQHIDPEIIPIKPLDPVVVNTGNNIAIVVMIIMAILGLVGVVYGLKTQNYIVLAVGVVVIVAGFFVSGPIAEFIGRFT